MRTASLARGPAASGRRPRPPSAFYQVVRNQLLTTRGLPGRRGFHGCAPRRGRPGGRCPSLTAKEAVMTTETRSVRPHSHRAAGPTKSSRCRPSASAGASPPRPFRIPGRARGRHSHPRLDHTVRLRRRRRDGPEQRAKRRGRRRRRKRRAGRLHRDQGRPLALRAGRAPGTDGRPLLRDSHRHGAHPPPRPCAAHGGPPPPTSFVIASGLAARACPDELVTPVAAFDRGSEQAKSAPRAMSAAKSEIPQISEPQGVPARRGNRTRLNDQPPGSSPPDSQR